MALREKPWDCALSSSTAAACRKRRLDPDGFEKSVGYRQTAAGERIVYPWDEMKDGDFFYAPLRGSSKAQRTAFLQAAARHDIEISVSLELGNTCFRVIRVLGNISKVKSAARERGAYAPSSDIDAYYKRQAAWRRDGRSDHLPATDIADPLPTPPPRPAVPHPVAPLGTGVDAREARDKLVAEQRRRAAMELAGLDPDEDEDYMGVGSNSP